MRRTHSRRRQALPLLSWVFRRGAHLLTCQLDQQPTGTYRLSLMSPRGTRGHDAAYDSVTEALHQHAAVASALRDLGWRVVDRTPAGRTALTSAVA